MNLDILEPTKQLLIELYEFSISRNIEFQDYSYFEKDASNGSNCLTINGVDVDILRLNKHGLIGQIDITPSWNQHLYKQLGTTTISFSYCNNTWSWN